MKSKAPATPRNLRPRAEIVTPAETVTQHNCLQVLGIDDRRFLDYFRDFEKASRLGQLLVVETKDAVAFIRSKRANPASSPPVIDGSGADFEDVDSVLAHLGRRRAR